MEIILIVMAIMGALLNVWQEDGYKMGILWEKGVFQMGVLMSFILGAGGAVMALYSGAIGVSGVLPYDCLFVFFTAFMIPFLPAKFLTKSSIGNEME